MNQVKTERTALPVDEPLDPEVISFRAQFDEKSPLDELVREGARKMLQAAIDAEVEGFLAQHANRLDERGRRLHSEVVEAFCSPWFNQCSSNLPRLNR
ncbi:hypothetical protein Q31b_41700 [Novipirellula aureliae]|uniref:Transposase, Mutator family n=1 Tax=Novipirellula aureliae TaxID=2527966 RepID=A0A5C6DQQ7_9BACT|nr:hypothetical protein [Novipirellula aureliae]TWU39088.1 hypothetical protein Q31b_41700 [Novipirellula aureliae]